MRLVFGVLSVLVVLTMTDAKAQDDEPVHQVLSFADLEGWGEDDHAEALTVFLKTCGDMRAPGWSRPCALASSFSDARGFFEQLFLPVLIEDGSPALFTGYFEPELNGSRDRTGRFRHPIYHLPAEAVDGQWYTRADIEGQALLEGRGLEIAWIDDPVDVFFLQIQGSGRIRMRDGSMIRVGYAGANGHEYRSIGQELVRRGVVEAHEVSAQVIRSWIEANPTGGTDLLWHNPSFVFFRLVNEVPAERGPLGAMNRSVTDMRTIAVDPAFVPLGAPVWIEKKGEEALNRLMIAQDTGSAIKGAQRADIFFGTGPEAGRLAGEVRDPGRMVVLMPTQEAYARAEVFGP